MRTIQRRIFGTVPLLLAANFAFAATSLSVPSDPNASYEVLSVKRAPSSGQVFITTQRTGPSGISFAKRLVNCPNQTFRYVGDADTLKELKTQNLNGKMGELVEGSISWYAAQYACSHTLKK